MPVSDEIRACAMRLGSTIGDLEIATDEAWLTMECRSLAKAP